MYDIELQRLNTYAYLHQIELWPLVAGRAPLTLDEAINFLIQKEYLDNASISPVSRRLFDNLLPDSFDDKVVAVHFRRGYTHGKARTGRNTSFEYAISSVNHLQEVGYTVADIDCSLKDIPASCFHKEHPSHYLVDGYFSSPRDRSFALISSSKYFVGSQSGPLTFRHCFGHSFILANNTSIGAMSAIWMPNSFMLPKVWKHNYDQGFVSIKQILSSPMGWFEASEYKDYSLIESDPRFVVDAIRRQNSLSLNDRSIYTELEKKFALKNLAFGAIGPLSPPEEFIRSYYSF